MIIFSSNFKSKSKEMVSITKSSFINSFHKQKSVCKKSKNIFIYKSSYLNYYSFNRINKVKAFSFCFNKQANCELNIIKTDFKNFCSNLNQKYELDKYDKSGFYPKSKFELNNHLKDIVQVEENDHPCFTNLEYVKRKQSIQKIALNYNLGQEIPIINYTDSENKAWEYVTSRILQKVSNNCCKEYNENLKILMKETGLCLNKIPQLRDVSKVLEYKTGFTIAPVAGLLRPRYFLNLLAYKVFASTQFIRPLERCEHNGEPDILHEVLGHTAMFCDRDFADFSQEIGLASLGASEENIKKLANIYWFTIEYGLVKEDNKIKIYGGGIIPSIFEIDYALSMKATYNELDFNKMQTAYYDYVNLSTNYFVADSIESMKLKFKEYSKLINTTKIK